MPSRRQSLLETLAIFAVFFVHGAWPVPGVNEPYYLGKALHFWDPSWAPGDFFLESADAHRLFCLLFGWVTLGLSLPASAWLGRVVTWALLAWAWRRLSFRLLRRPWWGVLSAGLLVALCPRFAMAGEWIIGGVEAKGFAFVAAFLGLEALVAGRWNRMWILLGCATALHSLVGGWSIVAAGAAWLTAGSARPSLRSMLPAMAVSFALSLLGMIPSLALSWGVERSVAAEANNIYVYQRLGHHLDPLQFNTRLVVGFALLVVLWILLSRVPRQRPGARRFRAFVDTSLLIAAAGLAIGIVQFWCPVLAAELLRFYWFRLADAAVPMGVALFGTGLLARLAVREPKAARWLTVAAGALVAGHLGVALAGWGRPGPTVSDEFPYHDSWRDVCEWIARSDIPRDARFLAPRTAQTFKWYTGRAEVVCWKEIPQDARSIVEYWRRLKELYWSGKDPPDGPWYESLIELEPEELEELGRYYGATYVVDFASQPLALERLYENADYVVYKLSGAQ